MKKKLLLSIIPLFVFISILAFLPPAPPAFAQEPTCTPVITNPIYIFPEIPTAEGWENSDVPAESLMWDTDLGIYGPWIHDSFSIYDAHYLYFEGGSGAHYAAVKLTAAEFLEDVGQSGTSFPSEQLTGVRWYKDESTSDPYGYITVEYADGSVSEFIPGGPGGYHYRDHDVEGKQIVAFYVWMAYVQESGYVYISDVSFYYNGCQDSEGFTCATVDDFHFTNVPTDTWTLDGSAAILSSTLTLNPTGAASQTLTTTLVSSTTYNAVISVTNALSAPVTVFLDGMSQTITIDAAGLYTVPFTATETISNPSYILINNGESEHYVDVDWTCVYQGGVITAPFTCLAPLNGEFTTADNWDWYKSAAWNSPDENAFLPFNQGGDENRALIVTTAAYSLPTLTGGQYLLMQFNASAGGGQEAIVASRVLSAWHEFNVSGGEVYTYEHDISSMAGQSVTVAFANAGDDGSAGATECEFPAQDNVVLDNVCIYVADRPATDPPGPSGGFCPADLGFDYGCADVVPLLLGYGINVQGLDDVYATGVSVWEVQNYIPWLVAALWHNVGHPISCFIVEFMRLAVGLVEHEVNVFANYVNWVYSFTAASPTWWQTGFFYLTGVDLRIHQAQAAEGGWWNWLGNSLRAVFYNQGVNSQTVARYIVNIAVNLGGGLREDRNQLAADVSQIMTDLMGIWNNSIIRYFYATASGRSSEAIPAADITNPTDPWASAFELLTYLLDMVGSVFNMAWTLLSWLINTFIAGSNAPVEAYHSFAEGVTSEAAEVEVQCVDDNFWCYFWAGIQLMNQTSSQSILYPLIIVGLVLATIIVVWANIYAAFQSLMP